MSNIVGVFNIKCSEYMSYQYMPIKMAGSFGIFLEPRLEQFSKLINASIEHFIYFFGHNKYKNSYVYLTLKSGYQRNGCSFNRQGWHIDGFGTDDQNYIWSNIQPTIFNSGPFELSDDEYESMTQMEQQARPENNYYYSNNSLIWAGKTVHRVGDYVEGHRVFFKLSFSKDKYNLLGNTHNYLIDYNWDMVERKPERNLTSQ